MLLIRPSQVQLIERALALVEEGSEQIRRAQRGARAVARECWARFDARARGVRPRRGRRGRARAAAAGAGRVAIQPVRDRIPARAGGGGRHWRSGDRAGAGTQRTPGREPSLTSSTRASSGSAGSSRRRSTPTRCARPGGALAHPVLDRDRRVRAAPASPLRRGDWDAAERRIEWGSTPALLIPACSGYARVRCVLAWRIRRGAELRSSGCVDFAAPRAARAEHRVRRTWLRPRRERFEAEHA